MQVCETFLSKKWQTVMWHRKCEQSIHVQQPRGLDLREKSWFKTQDLMCQGQGLEDNTEVGDLAYLTMTNYQLW